MDEKTEVKYLRVLVDNGFSDVPESRLPEIEAALAELDVSNIGSITSFGSDTQKHMEIPPPSSFGKSEIGRLRCGSNTMRPPGTWIGLRRFWRTIRCGFFGTADF